MILKHKLACLGCILEGMTPLYDSIDFEQAKSRKMFALQCEFCGNPFMQTKHLIQATVNGKAANRNRYCSSLCRTKARRVDKIHVTCKQCEKDIWLLPSEMSSHKTRKFKNHFCSYQCQGVYGSSHRTTGVRRSKLEIWLETQLTLHYPELNVRFNEKKAIQAELDIYIPSLALAFELNGPLHYEPIFGVDKLSRTQNWDRYKLHACTGAGIDLCVIDTSSVSYFKRGSSEHFLKIIIDRRRSGSPGRIPTDIVHAENGSS